jgi:hypothetical protein
MGETSDSGVSAMTSVCYAGAEETLRTREEGPSRVTSGEDAEGGCASLRTGLL